MVASLTPRQLKPPALVKVRHPHAALQDQLATRVALLWVTLILLHCTYWTSTTIGSLGLPIKIILQICGFLVTINDALHLARCSKHLHAMYETHQYQILREIIASADIHLLNNRGVLRVLYSRWTDFFPCSYLYDTKFGHF